MSNFFVNIPSDVADPGVLTINGDATVDQIVTGDGGFVASTTTGTTTITANNLGVNAGQTSGTDHRPSMAFVQNAVIVGNNLGFTPPYGFNNPSVVTGLVIAGNASYSCPFIGSNLLFDGVSQGYLGFLKDSGSATLPAIVNNDTAHDNDLYFSLLHRASPREDLIKFGADGSLSLLSTAGSVFLGPVELDWDSSGVEGTFTISADLVQMFAALGVAGKITAVSGDPSNPSSLDYLYVGNALGVGVAGALNASILCDMQSISQGFRPPCMTTTQKNSIATPAEGLVVYDLSLHALCVFNGTAWKTITAV